MVMEASFVGTGTTLKSWSYVTAGNKFVCTIYLVHMTSVAIGDEGAVTGGQDIYIVRAGGTLDYKGHPVLAKDPMFDLFPLNTTYVFFGQKVSSNLYKVNSDESLQESNGFVEESNKKNVHAALYNGRGTKSVLSEAFSAWQAPYS